MDEDMKQIRFTIPGQPFGKQEKKYRVRFFADGTKEQLGKLIAFMNENNIKYGKIAKESK